MASKMSQCVFCKLTTLTRGHHLIPKCKSGTTIVPTCQTCEEYIHANWSHNELRDVYNTVESIIENEKFQKFLKWRWKQPTTSVFKSSLGKTRDKNKYH